MNEDEIYDVEWDKLEMIYPLAKESYKSFMSWLEVSKNSSLDTIKEEIKRFKESV